MLGVEVGDLDHRGGEQSLDVAHGADEPLALAGGERREQRLGDGVAAAVELAQLGEAVGGRARDAHAPVLLAGRHGDHPVGLERAQQPAQVPGVEPQPRPQRPHLAAAGADLPQHARLAQRPVEPGEVVVERADPRRHRPVEAAHLLDLR